MLGFGKKKKAQPEADAAQAPDLPEITLLKTKKKRKERKAGGGWLPGGAGAGGGAGQVGSASAGHSLLGGLLATKAGTAVATMLVAGVFAGGGLVMRAAMQGQTGVAKQQGRTGEAAHSASGSPEEYIPAILRSKAEHTGSALEMFNATNKGLVTDVGSDVNPYNKKKEAESKPAEQEQVDPNAAVGDIMSGVMGGGEGDGQGALGSALGNAFGGNPGFGSSPFGSKGINFSNNFGSKGLGSFGPQGVSAGGIGGSSFDNNLKKDSGRLRDRRFGKRPGGRSVDPSGKDSNKLLAQLRQMSTQIKPAAGMSNVDAKRSSVDQAWEGQTIDGEGAVGPGGQGLGGAGLDGGGIVSSPSLDNDNTTGGGGGANQGQDPGGIQVPDKDFKDESPWKDLGNMAMMLLAIANVIIIVEAILVILANSSDWAFGFGEILRAIASVLMGLALALGAIVAIMGIIMASTYGQVGAGLGLTFGGLITAASAAAAFGGVSPGIVLVGAVISQILGMITVNL